MIKKNFKSGHGNKYWHEWRNKTTTSKKYRPCTQFNIIIEVIFPQIVTIAQWLLDINAEMGQRLRLSIIQRSLNVQSSSIRVGSFPHNYYHDDHWHLLKKISCLFHVLKIIDTSASCTYRLLREQTIARRSCRKIKLHTQDTFKSQKWSLYRKGKLVQICPL